MLNPGYILINTDKIPDTDEIIEEFTQDITIEQFNSGTRADIIIESDEIINIKFNDMLCVIQPGKYFFISGSLGMYHSVRIMEPTSYVKMQQIMLKARDYTMNILKSRYSMVLKNVTTVENHDEIVVHTGMFGKKSEFNFEAYELFKPHKDKVDPCQDPEKNTCSQYIYHNDIHLVQKDIDVTDYFTSYDKTGIRMSNPPCIAVSYREKDFDDIKHILQKKYSINISKPKVSIQYIPTTQEEQNDEVLKLMNKLYEGENAGYFKIVNI